MATSDIQVGKHTVTWTTPIGGTPVTLGFTKEGSVIAVKKQAYDREAHELMAPFGRVYTGCEVTAKLVIMEWNLDNIAKLLNSTKTGSSPYSVDETPLAGVTAVAGKLVFHPVAQSAAVTHDKTINAAVLDIEQEWNMKVNADLSFNLAFRAIPTYDAVQTTKLMPLLTIGDPATAVLYTP